MAETEWTKDAPNTPGFYWVRRPVATGVKQLKVAEFVGDDEIWMPGAARPAAAHDLGDWEWWSVAIETPPK